MRKAAVAFGAIALAPWLVLFGACSSTEDSPRPATEAAAPPEEAAREAADEGEADGGRDEADADADAAPPLVCDGALICEDFETDPFASRWSMEVDPGGSMKWIVGGASASPGHAIASVIPTTETREISAVATRSFDVGPSGKVDLRVDVRIDSLMAAKPVLAIASPSSSVAIVIGPSSATMLRASLEITTSSGSTFTSTTLFPARAGQWRQFGMSLDTTNATASASVPDGDALTAAQVTLGATTLSLRVGVEDAEQPSTTRVTFDDVVVESP